MTPFALLINLVYARARSDTERRLIRSAVESYNAEMTRLNGRS